MIAFSRKKVIIYFGENNCSNFIKLLVICNLNKNKQKNAVLDIETSHFEILILMVNGNKLQLD